MTAHVFVYFLFVVAAVVACATADAWRPLGLADEKSSVSEQLGLSGGLLGMLRLFRRLLARACRVG